MGTHDSQHDSQQSAPAGSGGRGWTRRRLLGGALVGAAVALRGVPALREAGGARFALADREGDAVHLLGPELERLGACPLGAPVGLGLGRGRRGGAAVQGRSLWAERAVEPGPQGCRVWVEWCEGRWCGPAEGSAIARRAAAGELRAGVRRAGGELGELGGRAGVGAWTLERDDGWLVGATGSGQRLPGFDGAGELLELRDGGVLAWAPGHLLRVEPDGRLRAAQGGFESLSAALELPSGWRA